jgi:hypothetical protein
MSVALKKSVTIFKQTACFLFRYNEIPGCGFPKVNSALEACCHLQPG